MKQQLAKQFEQLEAERKAMFSGLKSYSDELINKKPSPAAWSVAEVISHVITAEEYSLKYLQKKIQDTSLSKPEGFKNKWRWLLIKFVFGFNIKFKAPELVEPKIAFTPLATLESRWAANRAETLRVLESLTDEELDKMLWKHAIAGKLNVHHMVAFFHQHFTRHRSQVERTIAAVSANR